MKFVDITQAADLARISVTNRSDAGNFNAAAGHVINLFSVITGALATIYLIYSGILYLTAAGNPDAAKKGQQGVVSAIIGIVFIVLANVIIRVVKNTVQ